MTTTVADVMTTEVAAVPETAGYKEIAALLRRHGVSVLPVLGPDRQVIGVVSEADVLDLHASRELPSGSDQAGLAAEAMVQGQQGDCG